MEWSGGIPIVGTLYNRVLLEKLLGPCRKVGEDLSRRHIDIAASIQSVYEDAFFNFLNMVYRLHGLDSLALAGGCAMNSVANGKVKLRTPFKNIYVPAGAGDAGGAVGAALVTIQKVENAQIKSQRYEHNHAYWGPEYSDADIEAAISTALIELSDQEYEVKKFDNFYNLSKDISKRIANGEVVGWFQGRAEWGPRALGNRSILGDPRRSDMQELLNLKIKKRESFRPFAPSILDLDVSQWFEQDGNVPFMMEVYQIKQHKREAIPAVTHVDGSGRLQTVCADSNSRYYQLISDFKEITGVPIILNTSFNENEPIVCKPEEALNCFLRTKMDVLALGNWVISRT